MSQATKTIFQELEKLTEVFSQSSSPATMAQGLRLTGLLKQIVKNEERLEGSAKDKPKFGVEIENKYTI